MQTNLAINLTCDIKTYLVNKFIFKVMIYNKTRKFGSSVGEFHQVEDNC